MSLGARRELIGRFQQLREVTRFHYILPLPVLQRALLELGRRLAPIGARAAELEGAPLVDPRLARRAEARDNALLSGTPGGPGKASHAAIVTREDANPAAIATVDGARHLRNGQWIRPGPACPLADPRR